jgi:hypothetical protein
MVDRAHPALRRLEVGGDSWVGPATRNIELQHLSHLLLHLLYYFFPGMNGLHGQDTVDWNVYENNKPTENEVAELISSIQEAQYFDASSMAPLTARSLVSIDQIT